MGYFKRATLAAVAIAAALAGPAEAAEVIVVDGGRAERVQDPAVPTKAEAAIGIPVGGAGSRPASGFQAATAFRSRSAPAAMIR